METTSAIREMDAKPTTSASSLPLTRQKAAEALNYILDDLRGGGGARYSTEGLAGLLPVLHAIAYQHNPGA